MTMSHWPAPRGNPVRIKTACLGAKTRVGLINDLVASATPIVGFHLGHGGIGRIDKAADGFTFVTEL